MVLLTVSLGCQLNDVTVISNEREEIQNFTTSGEVVYDDTFLPPAVVPLTNLKEQPIGTPDTLTLTSGYHQLKKSRPVKLSSSEILYDTSTLMPAPVVKPLKGERKEAGKRERVKASDPEMKFIGTKVFAGYDQQSGIKVNYCHDLQTDARGNLWGVLSAAGVFRFDGSHFYFMNEKQGLSPYATKIAFDNEDDLWIATGPRLMHHTGRYFMDYLIDDDIRISAGGIYNIMIDDLGLIWLSTNIGLYRIDPIAQTKVLYDEAHGIVGGSGQAIMDQSGQIWIANQEGITILVWKDKDRMRFDAIHYDMDSELIDRRISPNAELRLYPSKNGEILAYGGDGLTKLVLEDPNDYTKISAYKIGSAEGFYMNRSTGSVPISQVAEDNNGDFWMSMRDGTMTQIKWLTSASAVKHFPPQRGLHGDRQMHGDAQGNIWLSNQTYVLSRLYHNPFRPTEGVIAPARFQAMTNDKWGRSWHASSRGLYRSIEERQVGDPIQYLDYTKAADLSGLNITKLFGDSHGNLWIGTYKGGLKKVKLSEDSKPISVMTFDKEQGFNSTVIYSILEDQDGQIWCSLVNHDDVADGGIRRIDDQSYLAIGREQGLQPEPSSWAMDQAADGSFWVMAAGIQSIINYNLESDTSKIRFTHFKREHHMTGYLCKNIIGYPDGNVWLGKRYSDGLVRVAPIRGSDDYEVAHYTKDDGLPNTDITALMLDYNHDVWVSVNGAIAKIRKSTSVDHHIGYDIVSYGLEDGYVSRLSQDKQFFQSSDTMIWLQESDSSMVRFDPRALISIEEIPHVQIEKVSIFNEDIEWKHEGSVLLKNGTTLKDYTFDSLSNWTYLPLDLSLRHDNNFVSFDFAGITLKTPHRLEYSYFLEGYDQQWTQADPKGQAIYGLLNPGSYRFHVKSRLMEGDWSQPVSYSFEIRSPWWQTWLAYLCYALMLGGGSLAFVRFRINSKVKELKVKEELRQKISADLHDDVGTVLTGIAMQSEYLSIKKPDDLEKEMLDLSAMSRNAMEKMRDIIWAMDTDKNRMFNLIDKMRHHAEQQLSKSRFQYSLETKGINGTTPIPPEAKQNLYLIYKEAIANVLKHSNGDRVTIKLAHSKKKMLLSVNDNGASVSKTHSEGVGLSNMKRRAAAIQGVFRKNNNDGFLIEVEVPI